MKTEYVKPRGPWQVGSDGVANWKRASQKVTLALAQDIAMQMSADNPRFDRARFLKACGVQS